jgi:hypothetical protein
VLGSAGVLVAYSLFIAPKEQQMFASYGARLQNHRYTPPSAGEPPTPADHALRDNFVLSYVTTKGTLIVALSVLLLSCGTLATLLLVIFNRRITLRQISYSLAQISDQLTQLQTGKASGQ